MQTSSERATPPVRGKIIVVEFYGGAGCGGPILERAGGDGAEGEVIEGDPDDE